MIVLLTDFGYKDTYIGEMKAVIYSIVPYVNIVDLTHNIEAGDIKGGLFNLLKTKDVFVEGTVFCCVVDPGVGTDRQCLMGKNEKYYFVGPDNGLLSPFFPYQQIYQIPKDWKKKSNGRTFDGRDLFAVAAAKVFKDNNKIKEGISLSRKPIVKNILNNCEVIWVDNFGNVILSIKRENFFSPIKHKNFEFKKIYSSYEELKDGFGLIEGGSGFLEIAGNGKNASEILNLKRGDKLNA